MTWYYRVSDDGSSLDIWDHTQDPSVDDPLSSLTNDGSGFIVPDDVLDVMDDELTPEVPSQAAQVTNRGAAILRRMARHDIQEYSE